MKLSQLLNAQLIQIPLVSDTKEAVLSELVQLLSKSAPLPAPDSILEKIMTRERKMSTGIGYGVAVPHAKLEELDAIQVAVGISRKGIPFEAIDDEPVHLLFMMLSPQNIPGIHIQTLSAISRIMSYEEMRSQLKSAENAEDFLRLLAEGESKFLK